MPQQPLTFLATTPRSVSPAIAFFCSQISSEQPVYTPVEPYTDAAMGMCYSNVTLKGEQALLGWLIWELPKAFLTAEHHAVVQLKNSLVDVTPTLGGEKQVLFLPDADSEFTIQRPDNQFHPLSNDARITRMVNLKRRNAYLERDKNYFRKSEYQRNDSECCRLLESFFQRKNPDRKDKRKERKKERKRKKVNR